MLFILLPNSLWKKEGGKKQAFTEYFLTQQLTERNDADALGSR